MSFQFTFICASVLVLLVSVNQITLAATVPITSRTTIAATQSSTVSQSANDRVNNTTTATFTTSGDLNSAPLPSLSRDQQALNANSAVHLTAGYGESNQQLRPSIHWGRCPQLQPTLQEKVKKAQVITKCLENTPVPENITRETIEMHRELVAACALKEEGWFEMLPNASVLSEPLAAAMKAAVAEVNVSSIASTLSETTESPNISEPTTGAEEELDEELYGYSAIFSGGAAYNYSKAEREIRSKRLQPEIEQKVLQFHENCKNEAQHKYANPVQIIAQIQLYQACMDYFISDVCQIQVQV